MSEAQAKATPSKAAMELAEVCRNLSAPYDYATAIQSALSNLLGKADKVLLLTHEHISPTLAKELLLELHRWKPK